MPKVNKAELFPVVDPDGRVIGSATRRECHDGRSRLLHPVVHLHIVSPDRSSILLQRRSMTKDIQPGRWDTAVGGHVDAGESVGDALLREAREEIGVDATGARHLMSYIWESERERELVNVFVIEAEPSGLTLTPDPDEVDEVRFWPFSEIDQERGGNLMTPNFEQEFDRIRTLL